MSRITVVGALFCLACQKAVPPPEGAVHQLICPHCQTVLVTPVAP